MYVFVIKTPETGHTKIKENNAKEYWYANAYNTKLRNGK